MGKPRRRPAALRSASEISWGFHATDLHQILAEGGLDMIKAQGGIFGWCRGRSRRGSHTASPRLAIGDGQAGRTCGALLRDYFGVIFLILFP